MNLKKLINSFIFFFFSAFGGVMYAVAKELSLNGQIRISVRTFFVGFIVFFLFSNAAYYIPLAFRSKNDSVLLPWQKPRMFSFFILLLGLYLICFLTYFPGVGMNDGLNILRNGLGTIRQFPVAYVLILTFFGKVGEILGGLQWGIALYSLFQVGVVCWVEAMLLEWIWTRTNFKVLQYGAVIFFVAEPLLPMYAIAMLKDTTWSLFVVCLMVYVYELTFNKEEQKSKWFWLGFGFSLCSVLLLRNNGVYIVIPLVLILILCLKPVRKNLSIILLLLIVVQILNQLPIKLSGRYALFQEKAGIPLQQICAVVSSKEGVMTQEQEEFINRLMPLEEIRSRYNPYTADTIKWGNDIFDREFLNENPGEFLKVWAEMLPKNFNIYVKAYLQQTFSYWAPLNEHSVQCFFSIENSQVGTFCEDNGIHDQPIWPDPINNILRRYYRRASIFLNEGVLFWITMGALLIMLLRYRRWSVLLPYLPLLLLWSTIMISTPVSRGLRYVFAFVYALPMLVLFVFKRPEGF